MLKISRSIFFVFIFLCGLFFVDNALAQDPPSSHFTGSFSSVACSGDGYLQVGVQNNILAGQSTRTTFYVNGVLQTSDTFIENGPYTNYIADYGIGSGGTFSYPSGTRLRSIIYSYDGPDATGNLRYISDMTFTCNGALISLNNGFPTTSVPTMTEWGMIIFMVLAGVGAVYYMRRQKRAHN